MNARETFLKLPDKEERIKSLIEAVETLANIEEKILVTCIQSKPDYKNIVSDFQKKNAIDSNFAKLREVRILIKEKQKLIQEFLYRLNSCEETYLMYNLELTKDMENQYYGQAKDGSDIWAEGKPREPKKRFIQTEIF